MNCSRMSLKKSRWNRIRMRQCGPKRSLALLVLQAGLVGFPSAGATHPAPGEEDAGRAPPSDRACAMCHGREGLSRKLPDGTTRSLFVAPDALEGSIHEGLTCVSCHMEVRELPHPPGEPVPRARCDSCHSDIVKEHRAGLHGSGGILGDRERLECSTCHGHPHTVLPSDAPESPTFRTRIPGTCAQCHGELRMVVENLDRSLRQPFFSYRESVHGKAVEAGSLEAAVCTDCHASHGVRPPSDPLSPSFRFNVPQTCGHCHEEVLAAYGESIHGQAVLRGSGRSPVCTDCHGIHDIKSPLDPTSSVSARAIARTTCPQCHRGVSLSNGFGPDRDRVETYMASYHGLALRRGSTVVANCASCHGIHGIFPSSDPRSTVHPDRLPETCGECHPGAGENFVHGKIHGFSEDLEGPGPAIVAIVERVYFGLILLLAASMLLHNSLDLRRKADPAQRVLPASHLDAPRMNLHERIQHAILVLCFLLLVLTGFALRFPESWLSVLLGEGEATRRVLHRAAGVALAALGLYHIGYVLLSRKGREAWRALRPSPGDLGDAARMVRFNLGLRRERPPLRRFSYAEKLEYWAVVWGTALMALTGFILWFKMFATEWLSWPLWVVDLARVVHYYEAWLATIAILLWHLYFVIFDPAVYPMSRAWWSGWISKRPPEEG